MKQTNDRPIKKAYEDFRALLSGEHSVVIECNIEQWLRRRMSKHNRANQKAIRELLDRNMTLGGLHCFLDQREQAAMRLPPQVILIDRSSPIKAKLAGLLHEFGHILCYFKKCRCVEPAHRADRQFMCERHADEYVLSSLLDGGSVLKDVLRRMVDNIEHSIKDFDHPDYSNIRRTAVWRRAKKQIGAKTLRRST